MMQALMLLRTLMIVGNAIYRIGGGEKSAPPLFPLTLKLYIQSVNLCPKELFV